MKRTGFRDQVYAIVRQIPSGSVATYGQVATLIESPRLARVVGMALSALKFNGEDEVPWHRVINAAGRISAPGDTHRYMIQKAMLESEGVVFDDYGKCSLATYGWKPDPSLLSGLS